MVQVLRRMLAAAVVAGLAGASQAADKESFILNGYSMSGLRGVDTAALEPKLKHKEGDRVTAADVKLDEAIVIAELKAEHVNGRLVTSLATKSGHVWVIFDLLDDDNSPVTMGPRHTLASQTFEGATHVPVAKLDADTGLKVGDVVTNARMNAAHKAIIEAYAKAMPGKTIKVKAKMQVGPDKTARLTWIIEEPK